MSDVTAELAVTRLAGRLGARVEASVEEILDSPALRSALRDALSEHLVLVLPEASPTPEQHVELTRIFGEIAPREPQNPAHETVDEVTVFDSAGGYRADSWHCDATYKTDVPRGASLCLRVRPAVGGDTVWSNCTAAYEALSGGMKKLLDGRRALHEITPGHSAEHPVVAAHPETGRPVLFVNRIFTRTITNLPPSESAAVLPFLLEHVARPDFTYRHQWREGDVVVWDNWATQHYALFDYDEQRVAHRVSLAGAPLDPFTHPER